MDQEKGGINQLQRAQQKRGSDRMNFIIFHRKGRGAKVKLKRNLGNKMWYLARGQNGGKQDHLYLGVCVTEGTIYSEVKKKDNTWDSKRDLRLCGSRQRQRVLNGKGLYGRSEEE